MGVRGIPPSLAGFVALEEGEARFIGSQVPLADYLDHHFGGGSDEEFLAENPEVTADALAAVKQVRWRAEPKFPIE